MTIPDGGGEFGRLRRGPPEAPSRVRRRITVTGIVQGVGFRPFVWRRATRFGLVGWVKNGTAGVVIEVEGPIDAVDAFVTGLVKASPPLAAIATVSPEERPVEPHTPPDGSGDATERRFVILASDSPGDAASWDAGGLVAPPDAAACPACLAEVFDPADRRHRYPFTNCTDCGPRYSIIERLPYDRASTTMRPFAMCARCAREYEDAADRRFHAQPNACPECGPACTFLAPPAGGAATGTVSPIARGDAALVAARDALVAGRIVAVKGIGGYRLACDATNAEAVGRLRAAKRRPAKPLAVMVADVAAARRIAACDEQERCVLESAERPILLLRRAARDRLPIADAVAPHAPTLGVMLPDAPLHHLLCAGLPPLVMTSGNIANEPILHDDAEAVDRLADVADAFLVHDRPIQAPCDDSVVRCMAGVAVPVRRSRGAVPLVVGLEEDGPVVLAVGGDLKAAPCVTRGSAAICGIHVGDLGSLASLEALDRAVAHLLALVGVEPQAVAVDLHPGWISTAWARRWAMARGIPIVPVQHHAAHVAALWAEQGGAAAVAAEGCLGVCFDGTGYGADGTIRGGEFFVVDSPAEMRRIAALAAWPLPGGDAIAGEPWRAALGLLHAAGVAWDASLPPVRAADARAAAVIRRQLDGPAGRPRVGSMGRLFDAVAALAGVRQVNRYESEAALDLEGLAADADRDVRDAGGYRFGIEATADPGGCLVVTWHDLIRAVVADVRTGVDAGVIAARFHAAVAAMIGDVCGLVGKTDRVRVVGLTGGVFQNAVLTEAAVSTLRRAGFEPALHHRVAPNDGGLALGQVVIARRRLMTAARATT